MDDALEERNRELRRRLQILRAKLEAGQISFASHLAEEMKKSLMAVRVAADGEIDLDTVDARVRATALAMTVLDDREQIKNQVSLREIQSAYFRLLDQNFGHLYKQMVDRQLNPHEAAKHAASDPDFVKLIVPIVPQFMEMVAEFWANVGEVAHIHLEDAASLKAIYGGDLFPSAFANIASTCGVYMDTIVLPEPFLRCAGLFTLWTEKRRTYYFVKHALNVLSYQELALADVEPPIVAVLPDRTALDEGEQELIGRISRADGVVHAGKLFDRSFSSFDDALDFVDRFEDTDALARALARPDRLLFDVEWTGTTQEQVARALKEQPELKTWVTKPGRIALMQAVGRMGQANDLLLRSQRLHGTLLVEAPTSWRYLAWKLEYDAGRLPQIADTALHVARALQAAVGSGRVAWLGRVPPSALIDMRRQGAIPELRSMLSEGIDRLVNADPANFGQTADHVIANLDGMLADHKSQIKRVNAKIAKFGMKDVGSWLAIGSIEITAAATGTPLYGLLALAGNQLLDVPKLHDFPKKIRELVEESRTTRSSPVGLLFEHRR